LNNGQPGDGRLQWQPKVHQDVQNVSNGGKGLAEKSGKDTDRKRMLPWAFSNPDPESPEQAMKGGKGGGKGGKAHDKGRCKGVGKQHGKQVMKCPRAGSGSMGHVLGKQFYDRENNPGVATSSTAPRAHKQNDHPSNSQVPEPGRHWTVRERDMIYEDGVNPPVPRRPSEGFSGAHTADIDILASKLSTCDVCKGTSFYASNFLEVKKDTYDTCYNPTSKVSMAKEAIKKITEGKSYKHHDRGGRDKNVINICWGCLGLKKYNNISHFIRNKIGTGEAHVIAYFGNQRKKRYLKECNDDPDMVDALFRAAIDHFPEHELTLKDAMEMVLGNPLLNKAADWIVNIAPHVYIMYKCPQCLECPTQIRVWLRGKKRLVLPFYRVPQSS
jgi:hypothetical protein